MKETIKSIIEWQEQTFPDATLYGQLTKFQNELQEWEASKHITDEGLITADIMELADLFIVTCGIARFNHVDFMFNFHRVVTELEQSIYAEKDLEEAIDAKMQINRARKWNKLDGQYQHKED